MISSSVHPSHSLATVWALLAVGAGALGCSRQQAPAPAASSSRPLDTAQAPAAASSSAPPSAIGSAATSPEQRLPELRLVARAERPIELGPPGTQLLVTSAKIPFRIDGSGLHQDLSLLPGLTPLRTWETLTFFGSFPENTVLKAHPEADGDPGACRTQSILNYKGDGWRLQQKLSGCEETVGVAPWKEGRAVAVVLLWDPDKDWRFALVAGKGPVALPAPTGISPAPAEDDYHACRTVSLPESAAGTSNGYLFVAGRKCLARGSGGPLVERWTPDSRKGAVDTLPNPGAKSGRYFVCRRPKIKEKVTL